MEGGWLLSLIAKEVGLLFFFMKGEWSFFSLNVKVKMLWTLVSS